MGSLKLKIKKKFGSVYAFAKLIETRAQDIHQVINSYESEGTKKKISAIQAYNSLENLVDVMKAPSKSKPMIPVSDRKKIQKYFVDNVISIDSFAKENGLSKSFIYSVVNGSGGHVTKSFKKLLDIINGTLQA